MRCVLIYNPVSGRNRSSRLEQVNRIARALSAEGHSTEVISTTEPGSASSQAREAASAHADVIFACGGDGTVHEVLQGLVSASAEPASALGVIPLGSANALARHLRLSLDPVTAALQQLRGKACIVPVGKVTCPAGIRYFAVMAGAGPDGELVHNLLTQHKEQLGRLAYYLNSAQLFAMRRFPVFEVEFTPSMSGPAVTRKAVGAMATRIGSLGGIFHGLTSPRASITDSALHLHILSPPALLSLPLWFLSGWLGLRSLNPFLQCIETTSFSCRPLNHSAPRIQADAESLGCLPMYVSLVPNALRILLPSL